MTEYDLVVVGSTPEAIYAAELANFYKARVALVTHPSKSELEVIRGVLNPAVVKDVGADSFILMAQELAFNLKAQNSLSSLSAKGVDVIKGNGEFCRLPQQALIVNERRLRSRSYLIATGCELVTPSILGVEEIRTIRPGELLQKDILDSFISIVIFGTTAVAVQFAQALNRLGKEIVLVAETSDILPQQDQEASRLIQAHLEAEGIKVITQSPLIQCKRFEDTNCIQVGNLVLEADAFFFANAYKLNTEGLNLKAMGINFAPTAIELNDKMQTTNPNIYVCGQKSKGVENIAKYEAQIAVKNALGSPRFVADYSYIPQTILSDPPLARVGLSETQAKNIYGSNIYVFQELYKNISAAQILEETSGFCKIIVSFKGEILGSHIVGHGAGELIGLMAIARSQKIKLKNLADFFPSAFTFSEIIALTSVKYNAVLNTNKFTNIFFSWLKR